MVYIHTSILVQCPQYNIVIVRSSQNTYWTNELRFAQIPRRNAKLSSDLADEVSGSFGGGSVDSCGIARAAMDFV